MYTNQMLVLKWIARFIYFRFSDRPDRRLSVGDACPYSGNCSSHPDNSHSDKKSFDHNYYTWGLSNSTQYRAGVNGDVEYDIVELWNRRVCGCIGCRDCGPNCLYEDVFDWERNYWLWVLIDKLFPNSSIMVHKDLATVIREHLTVDYGYETAVNFFKMVTMTEGTTYNHHTHAHISLSDIPSNPDGSLNLNFDFKEFQEKMRNLEK